MSIIFHIFLTFVFKTLQISKLAPPANNILWPRIKTINNVKTSDITQLQNSDFKSSEVQKQLIGIY